MPGSATRAIALLATASFAAQAMVRSTDSLLPQIAADLDATVGATSIIVTLYLLAHGSVQLVIGPVGDRFGKYLCVTLAAGFATLTVVACGLATSLTALVAARIACGLATGWIIPLAMAFIGDVIPMERRQQVLGTFLSGQILGQMFGQAASGVLGDYFGWRNVFFILAALLAAATACLVFELIRNPLTRWHGSAGKGGPGLVAGYKIVLSSAWARRLVLAAFVESAAMFGALTYVGAYLHSRFDVSFTLVGLFVGAFAIGGLAYSLSVRMLVRRLGQIGLSRTGGLLLCASFVLLATAPTYVLAPLATAGIGLGFYMLHNTLQVNATQMSPQARGTAVAIFSSALYLGQTAGVAVFAVIYDHFTAVPTFIIAAAMLLWLGLWISRHLKRRAAMGV
ncbi:MAG: MFS transporter [Pseudolabrys sp.]|nr:MFS transporter [Pseudolabrys sp.]